MNSLLKSMLHEKCQPPSCRKIIQRNEKVMNKWNEDTLNQYIKESIPESLNLDYKDARALKNKNEMNSIEITKDVSAMANSDGGILIYGIGEDNKVKPSVPSQITPVDANEVSKEQLEQVINTIRPRINEFIIHPVQLSTGQNHYAYVVEITKSTTAHQARDKKYYKRFNFESTAMEDYEIRDVMGRSQHPKIELKFKLTPYTRDPYNHQMSITTFYGLDVTIVNNGHVYAQYMNTYIHMPSNSLLEGVYAHPKRIRDGIEYMQFATENMTTGLATFGPLLPGIEKTWFGIQLAYSFSLDNFGESKIYWTAHADSAPVNEGMLTFNDLVATQA